MARGRQLASVRLGVSFGPFLNRQALRGHDRNAVSQYPARRKLQLFVRSRRVTEANNIGKRLAITTGRCSSAPDYLDDNIAGVDFR
jgi:hypothetical protein